VGVDHHSFDHTLSVFVVVLHRAGRESLQSYKWL
jgi:hypothetical protein